MVLLYSRWGFPHSSVGKASASNAGDPSPIPKSGRSTREGIGYPLQYSWASLMAQLVKNLPANTVDLGLIQGSLWVGKIPWRRGRLPTPVFWPGEFHGLYSPWGCKELDITKKLSLFLLNFMLLIIDINFLGLFDNFVSNIFGYALIVSLLLSFSFRYNL